MKSLIIVSTHLEIRPFLSKNGLPSNKEKCSYSFENGIQLCVTGVGVPSTFVQLSNLLKEKKPENILQIGFAGSYRKEYSIGDMVEVKKDCFADLGIDDNGNFIPIIDAMPEFDGAYGWLSCQTISDLPGVTGATVNTGSGSYDRITSIRETWNPDVETMEGAAAMLFSQENNIPFSQIRVISNYVEPRNTKKWNIEKAASNLSDWLTEYLNKDT